MINPDLLYGYIPTEGVCATFVALFGLSTLIHLGEAIYFRLWWLLPTIILGGIGEVIGWSGRLWSSKTYLGNLVEPYLIQISTTIISPTPIVAANFVILGILIRHLGTHYSRLNPLWYTIVFCTADVVALVVQAIGGGQASKALQTGVGDPEVGGHIMLAGIVIQLVAITIYVSLAIEFLYRYYTKKPLRKPADTDVEGPLDTKIKLMIFGLCLSTSCIFIRAIYRTIELSDGWTGRIIRTEVYFNVLDGAMIVIAMYAINIFHPGILISHIDPKTSNFENDSKESSDIEVSGKNKAAV